MESATTCGCTKRSVYQIVCHNRDETSSVYLTVSRWTTSQLAKDESIRAAGHQVRIVQFSTWQFGQTRTRVLPEGAWRYYQDGTKKEDLEGSVPMRLGEQSTSIPTRLSVRQSAELTTNRTRRRSMRNKPSAQTSPVLHTGTQGNTSQFVLERAWRCRQDVTRYRNFKGTKPTRLYVPSQASVMADLT